MLAPNSITRFCFACVMPCVCNADDEWVHGFTLRDGKRDGMYLAARRSSGPVQWLDFAVSVGSGRGTIALRAWVDLETRLIRSRVVVAAEVDSHPALALGGWLNRVEVQALGFDIGMLTTQVVLGDDRLAAHLFDLPEALSPTALAPPLQPSSSASAHG
jgi:hypothetical protein